MDYMPSSAWEHSSHRSLLHESSLPLAIFTGSTGFSRLLPFRWVPGSGVCQALLSVPSLHIMRTSLFQYSLSSSWCYVLFFMLAERSATEHGSIPMPLHENSEPILPLRI